ncbi:hypothetical protein PsYK624_060440 [Phanerochaete sordida]|uniref:Uncharacterized protein n=1 Tax=Phanerochaete sordida TaxID=48140 RepID=A0A9P3G7W2_9APHY|nr:hypothetical protein PsYK624_060440 [Phanerochaete sordida]
MSFWKCRSKSPSKPPPPEPSLRDSAPPPYSGLLAPPSPSYATQDKKAEHAPSGDDFDTLNTPSTSTTFTVAPTVTLCLFMCAKEAKAARYYGNSWDSHHTPRGFGWKHPGSTETHYFGPHFVYEHKPRTWFAHFRAADIPGYPWPDSLAHAKVADPNTEAGGVHLHEMLCVDLADITVDDARRLEEMAREMHEVHALADGLTGKHLRDPAITRINYRMWTRMVAALGIELGILPESVVSIVTEVPKPSEPMIFSSKECYRACGPLTWDEIANTKRLRVVREENYADYIEQMRKADSWCAKHHQACSTIPLSTANLLDIEAEKEDGSECEEDNEEE